MRWLAVLTLCVLAGCTLPGCSPAGGTLTWWQPGIGEQLAQAPGVSISGHEARGMVLDAPGAATFLGAPPRLRSVGMDDGPRLAAPDGVVHMAGYVAEYPEVGPGPDRHRSDAVRLLTLVMDPEDAQAWVDEHLAHLKRDVLYDIPLGVDVDLGAALDGANGTWRITDDAEFVAGDVLWRLPFDHTSYWIVGHRAIRVIGNDRVVVDLHDHNGAQEKALEAAEAVLSPYGVAPDEPTHVTWTDRVVCTD